jgi:hypothetical protein
MRRLAALFLLSCLPTVASAEFRQMVQLSNRLGAHRYKYVLLCPTPETLGSGMRLANYEHNLPAARLLGCSPIPITSFVMPECGVGGPRNGAVRIKIGKSIGYIEAEFVEGCEE